MSAFQRYVALGDSFTEGVGDPGANGRDRGWADRVAVALAAGRPEFQYANLAIRGRRVAQIVAEQVPAAVAMQPDLITFNGGVNDALRPRWDIARLEQVLGDGLAQLSATGARVVVLTYGQPKHRSRVMGLAQGRFAEYRELTFDLAGRYGCTVVDFWTYRAFDDPRFWSVDRLHLNSVGHHRVSLAVLQALGASEASWSQPLPDARDRSLPYRLAADAAWFGQHLGPWIGRRLTGRSSGDRVTPKQPVLQPAPRG